MADEQEEAVSEEVSVEATEEDAIARLEAEVKALHERIAQLEAGAGAYAAAEHEHDYAGREHEHAEANHEPVAGGGEEAREEGSRETAPRSSHPYYRKWGEWFK